MHPFHSQDTDVSSFSCNVLAYAMAVDALGPTQQAFISICHSCNGHLGTVPQQGELCTEKPRRPPSACLMACVGLGGGAALGLGAMSVQTGEPQPWQISWNDTAWTASELFQARPPGHISHNCIRNGYRQAKAFWHQVHVAPRSSISCMHSRAFMVSVYCQHYRQYAGRALQTQKVSMG